MIATQTIEDLQSSLQMCLDAGADLSAKMRDQQSIIDQAQSEVRLINERIQERADQYNRLLPLERSALEQLSRAKDYAKVATGSIKNQALDDLRQAQESADTIHAQILAIQESQKPEVEKDQVLREALNLKISDAQSALAQLADQEVSNGQTRTRLKTELGKSLYAVHSAALSYPREKQERLEKELAQNAEVYTQLHAEAFEGLKEYPEHLRNLREENTVTDKGDIKALMLFAAFCEYVAEHRVTDMGAVGIFELDSYHLADMREVGSNSLLFREKSQQARQKIAELNHQ